MCGKDFTANGTLIRHKQAAHGPVVEDLVFSCSKCGMKFSRKDNLKRHNKEKHFGTKVNLDYVQDMDTLGVLECEQCDQTFKRKPHLMRHIRSVHGVKETHNCDQCGKTFSSKDALKRHVKTKH